MENFGKRRKRSENWSLKDKMLLRAICAQKLYIIENKNVDNETNRKKKNCWERITKKFNRFCEVRRDVNQVQFQWRNSKKRRKEEEEGVYIKFEQSIDSSRSPSPAAFEEDEKLIDFIPNEFKISPNDLDTGSSKNSHDVDLEESRKQQDVDLEASQQLVEPTKTSTIGRKRSTRFSKIVHDLEISHKTELFELTKAHMIEVHNERMDILRLERHCREKELEKLTFELDLLKEKSSH